MSVGPLRRLTGAVGLIALLPTAWLLATNAITLTDAAVRMIVTLVVVVAVGRLIGMVVGGLAGSFERDEEAAAEAQEGVPAGEASAVPGQGAGTEQTAQASARPARRSSAQREVGQSEAGGVAASR